MFTVFDIAGCYDPDQTDAEFGGESHGTYDTLEEARGCVEFDRLRYYEIWDADELIEQCLPPEPGSVYAAGYACACGYHD